MSNRHILIISFFTLLTVLAWITFDVYHVLNTSTVKAVDAEMIKPLNSNFDQSVINELKKNNQL